MKSNFILILFWFAFKTTQIRSLKIKDGLSCQINNCKYSNEYLFSSYYDGFDRQDGFDHKKVYTSQLTSIPDYRQSVWRLDKVKWLNNTFYLTNIYHENYRLCATHRFLDGFNYRRIVYLVKLNRESMVTNLKCVWEFDDRIDSTKEGKYMIWNRYYGEPLYAASFLFKSISSNKRNVYTWFKNPDSDQFEWKLNCF